VATVNEDLIEGRLLYMPQNGVVTRVDDPKGKHRVKASVDGICEETQWAYPLCAGGGGPGRGGHVAPKVGSDVVVIFLGGDIERPVYLPAWWGDDEVPEDLRDASPEEAARVQVLELDRYKVVVDEREGREQLVVQDKATGDMLQLDGATGGVLLKATTRLVLRCDGDVSVEGLTVTINGRPVLPDAKPIGSHPAAVALPPLLPPSPCAPVPVLPSPLCVPFPGGAEVCATGGYGAADLDALVNSLVSGVMGALAPLPPVTALMDFAKLVVDVLGAVAPPDPVKLAELLPELKKVLDKILSMYPPVPLVAMARGLLNAVVAALVATRRKLAALVAQAGRISAATARAQALPPAVAARLLASAACAQEGLDAALQNMRAGAGPLNDLLGVVNAAFKLMGLEGVPPLAPPEAVSEAALAPLDAAVEALTLVSSLVPVGPSLPALPP
jgi:hypothetical protein